MMSWTRAPFSSFRRGVRTETVSKPVQVAVIFSWALFLETTLVLSGRISHLTSEKAAKA